MHSLSEVNRGGGQHDPTHLYKLLSVTTRVPATSAPAGSSDSQILPCSAPKTIFSALGAVTASVTIRPPSGSPALLSPPAPSCCCAEAPRCTLLTNTLCSTRLV